MQDLKVTFPEPCSERWDEMHPAGCNRFCDRCRTTIHDLSALDVGEVETLLTSGEKLCVRAVVDASGAIATNSGKASRSLIATVGLSVALASQPAPLAASERRPTGSIEGRIQDYFTGSAIATSADGQVFTTEVDSSGAYKFRRLPVGTYSVQFRGGCEAPVETGSGGVIESVSQSDDATEAGTWSGGAVYVRENRSTLLTVSGPCHEIIVGQLMIDQGPKA